MRRITLALACALLPLGCASTDTTYERADDFDFSQLRTFGFMQPPPTAAPIRTAVRANVEKTLREKGYEPTLETPDFLLVVHRELGGTVEAAEWQYVWNGKNFRTRRFAKGTLLLDVVQGGSRRLLWRATATREYAIDATNQEREAGLTELLDELLAEFPAAGGGG